MVTTTERSDYGLLTPEAIERSKARIGIAQPRRQPHNLAVTPDGARHFAHGYGDGNPLWWDDDYARGTRWGSFIAPPNFFYTMGEYNEVPDAASKAALKGDPFAGLGAYQAVMEFEYYRPLRADDTCDCIRAQVGVQEKTSSFGGKSAHVTHDFLYANGKGEVLAIQRGTWIHAEREASKKRSNGKTVEFPPYTDEEIAAVDAAYDAEERRGAQTRYYEDVEVGDEISPRVKGPLTVTDLIVWHVGWGMQFTPSGSGAISRAVRRKVPGLFPVNSRNIPDTVQRLHWEPERAAELGIPMSYDYGALRENWLTQAVTDWMGDDAWLYRLRCEHRKFNYIGDITWIRGRVVDKKIVDGRAEVHLEVSCHNQRGEVTTPGTAVVLLPTREAPVQLPNPPADNLDDLLAHEISRFA